MVNIFVMKIPAPGVRLTKNLIKNLRKKFGMSGTWDELETNCGQKA